MRYIILPLIKAYQWCISPFFGNCCRFYPSCSHYAFQAFSQHNGLKATWLTFKRIFKCGFWHPGGIDNVPE